MMDSYSLFFVTVMALVESYEMIIETIGYAVCTLLYLTKS